MPAMPTSQVKSDLNSPKDLLVGRQEGLLKYKCHLIIVSS